MRFEAFSFGSSSDRRCHGRDVVIDHGEVCERKKRASKKFRDSFGHKPVSMQEEIPSEDPRAARPGGLESRKTLVQRLTRESLPIGVRQSDHGSVGVSG